MTDENAAGPPLEEFDSWLAENQAKWEAETRQALVECFEGLVGPHKTGDSFVESVWLDVLPPDWDDVPGYAKKKAWCGGTLLHVYRTVGIADGVHWQDGVGFVYPQNLPITRNPKPGDVAYKNEPKQHYGMATSAIKTPGSTVGTIEANSLNDEGELGIWAHVRPAGWSGGWTFFSIAPLLKRAVERAA